MSVVSKLTLAAGAAAIMGAVGSVPAQARLILAIDDPTTAGIDYIAVDDGDGMVGDATPFGTATTADGAAGGGNVNMTITGDPRFALIFAAATSSSTPSAGSLTLSVVSVSGLTADVALDIFAIDTDYGLGPGTLWTVNESTTGTTAAGTTVNTGTAVDLTNMELGPIALPDSHGTGTINDVDLTVNASSTPAAFSLAQGVRIDYPTAGAGFQPFSTTSVNTALTVTVDEAPGLLLGLAGLLGIGWIRRRR
ncbi:MAG: hypothetical protein KDC18_19760 [Alphaproteobacteria bacterium]|nr:hypothetical protein [Alphaproteobacteria bacterium]MCB9928325.1 hypothetical protein [Alphaproteobacteria bacterium]